jgi:hypothetical protein
MKKSIQICLVALACLALVSVVTAQKKMPSKNLITSNSVGELKIGMTVAQARKVLKGFTLERTSDGEGIALIGAREGEREYAMTIYAGEEDPEAKIDENAKIEMVEVLYSTYQTAAGVHPRMPVSEAEKKYGKVTEIMMSEIEAREYATFARQPKGLQFRVAADGKDAGKYTGGQRTSKTYTPGTYLHSITVMGADSMTGGNANFSSVYTELNKCNSDGGEDGGHVSVTCEGPAGYKIESYDSARFLHFRVEGDNFSRDLATQTFSFDSKKRKAEWRLADGKPFALIVRFNEVIVDEDTGDVKDGTGEFLRVKGLRGFEHIDFTVDARKKSNANEEARRLADNAYRKQN